jgi:hypothetical protein
MSTPLRGQCEAWFRWFGRHRPPTRPPGGGSWTCGTCRHGATGQRYAVGKQGVKPARTPRRRACG